MPKNTGKLAEEQFETRWATLGKSAWVFRLADAAEIFGRSKRIGNVRSQPSDYIVVHQGSTQFAEVKSSHDATAFRFSLLKQSQTVPAKMILAAGGSYFVYVLNMATAVWYRIPYQHICSVKDSGSSSIRWTLLEGYRWVSLM